MVPGTMDDTSREALNALPDWLRSLAEDLTAVAGLLKDSQLSEELRLWAAGAVGYVFKSVDLIPDGIDDLGYLDDAFILRVAASRALEDLPADEAAAVAPLAKLAEGASLIKRLLGSDYARLDDFVSGLRIAVVRGKSPSDIVEDRALAIQVCEEVASFARSYLAPPFAQDERTLIKLKSFLSAKLP
jgi:uncharacterized membrane protein YkvA (DUF1232 family)